MKANAITRIVIYSVVVLLLLGLLLTGLGIGQFMIHFDSGSREYITGELCVEASKIQNVEIEWVCGNIDIRVATDGSQGILVSESGYAGEELRAVWEIKGQTLVIKYSEPIFNIGFVSTPDKDLTIIFPADWSCQTLDIETVSGSVDVMLLSATEIKLECVSADCLFESCTADSVELNTVSGDVEYRGKVNTLDCEAVSADCKVLMMESGAKRLTMEAVSGDLIVAIREDIGFSASIDSMSGSIYSDFNTTSSGGKQTYGDGSCQIKLDAISGDIEIRKMELRLTEEEN